MDDPATVHELNVLTVVASEGYKEFVAGLQKEIAARRFRPAAEGGRGLFHRQGAQTATGDVPVTPQMAKLIYRYLIKNDYTDDRRQDHNCVSRRQAGRHARATPAGIGAYSDADLPAD